MSGRVVLDTNIIIYLSKKLLQTSKVFVADTTYFLSVISKMELLGYPFQNKIEEEYLFSSRLLPYEAQFPWFAQSLIQA